MKLGDFKKTYHIFDVNDVLADENVLAMDVDVGFGFFIMNDLYVFAGSAGGCKFFVHDGVFSRFEIFADVFGSKDFRIRLQRKLFSCFEFFNKYGLTVFFTSTKLSSTVIESEVKYCESD